jgi:hypothetical protein
MKRTRIAVHLITMLLTLATMLALGAAIVYSNRAKGVAGAAVLLIAAVLGGGAGYLVARRRARRHAPHRIVVRRGTWLMMIPFAIGSIIVAPSIGLWCMAFLIGLGLATVIALMRRIEGNNVAIPAGIGAAAGVIAVLVLSQANLRSSVDQVAVANGVSAEQTKRLPSSISLTAAQSLSTDPRTGMLAGSLREARQQTMTSQFTGSLRFAAMGAAASLFLSFLLPRHLLSRPLLGVKDTK